MNKQLCFTALLIISIVLSLSVVSASEVNVTDSQNTIHVDDVLGVENVDDGSSEKLLSSVSDVDNSSLKASQSSGEVESDNSNTLSTDNDNIIQSNKVMLGASLSDNASNNNKDVLGASSKTNTIISAVYSGNNLVVTLTNAAGKNLTSANVIVTINGVKNTLKTNSKGQVKVSTVDFAPGSYTAAISYNGNSKYNPSSKSIKFTVTKKTATALSKSYDKKSGELIATLTRADGTAISGANIVFNINGAKTSVKTNKQGQAKLSIATSGLKTGSYVAAISYAGNSKYLPSSASLKFTASTISTKLTAKDTSVYYKDDSYIVATLKDARGNPIEGVKVGFANNGVTYIVTDENGQAKYATGKLAVGTYTVKIAFYGKGLYLASNQLSVKLSVSKKSTKLAWKSSTSFLPGENTYEILLSDSKNVPLSGKTVKLTVNSKTYSATTNSKGYATFKITLSSVGTYTLSYSFAGDSLYAAASSSKKVSVVKKTVPDAYGYFVVAADMKKLDLNSLKSQGVKDLFLNSYAITYHGQSAVETWIASAKNAGMRVHISMVTFYENGNWVNPVKAGSAFTDKLISEAVSYAKVKGISGICLDYLRYPGDAYNTNGATDAISKFTKSITDAIHKVNPALIVSATLMPERTVSAHYYGQDYAKLSSYLDAVMPMVYKGNYGKTTTWITEITKWYVENSKGAKVWITLQSYNSDSNPSKLSTSALTKDVSNAIAGNPSGVLIFRYGISNMVDFKSLIPVSSSNKVQSSYSPNAPTSISINNVLMGAVNLKEYYEKNSKLPDTVKSPVHAFTMPEFLYLLSQAIYQIGNSNNNAIKIIYGVKAPSSPSGDAIDSQLVKSDYLTVAKNVANYIKTNNQAPAYASSSAGKIIYEELLDSFSRILAYYRNNNNVMPSYVTVKTTGTASSTSTGGSSSASAPTSVSINNILTGSANLKKYYESNGVLPNTVTVAGHAFTLPEFLYLMSQAIYQLNTSNTANVKCVYGVKSPSSPSGDKINNQLYKANYVTVAKNVANYIKDNNQAPAYASSAVGKIIYSELVDAFSRILAFYKSNDKVLPSYVTIKYGSSASSVDISVGGMNVKNTITNLAPYLQSTANCPVNNAAIKSVVNSLTNGLSSDVEKAVAIYNYVRDKIDYSYYYDTQKGATGTLSSKSGNCVDQAHLLIAMYRTAGLAARYEHGTCYFTLSGNTYGHIWTQVLIDGVWVVGDPTSPRNQFGVVNNWNTNTYHHNAYYASLPF